MLRDIEIFIDHLNTGTMALLAALLFSVLSLILVYTYFFRKTYPGFGLMAAAQCIWPVGLFSHFYIIIDAQLSLLLGDYLMTLHGVLMYAGLAKFGGVQCKKMNMVNIVAYACYAIAIYYFIYINFDERIRTSLYSFSLSFIACMIVTIPYIHKNYQRYAPDTLLMVIYFWVMCIFFARGMHSVAVDDLILQHNEFIDKFLLISIMIVGPMILFAIVSMTSCRMEGELNDAYRELKNLSQTDPLTQVANRGRFDEVYGLEWRRAARNGSLLAVAILDVDNFKRYNDTNGHQAGDECLRLVGRALKRCMTRAGELVARYGGEEFAFILPNLDCDAAQTVAESVRKAVEELRIPRSSCDTEHCVTVSIGVASRQVHHEECRDALLGEADKALYQAKASGKNAVVVFGGRTAEEA